MKHLLSLLFLLVFSAILSAQAPQMLNYQGVARSTNGSPLSNQSIKLRLSIQPANGNPFYVETHDVSTNQFGLYAVKIGQGAVVSGNFANIAWAQTAPFLQVEIDPAGGNNFTQVGAPAPLISVPYALEAQHAASATMGGDVTGHSTNSTVTQIQNRPVGNAAPATGDVLKWNGTQWQPGTDATSGGGSFSAGNGISISGNVISNNGDLSNTNEIQTLAINGPNLSLSNGGGTVTLPTGGAAYMEGVGIEINGNTISNAGDLDNFNELQTINLSGNTLTLSDGGGSVNLPIGVNYNEGTGIEINGNTISNSGDLDNFNELQSISLSGNVLTLSDGGGSVTLPPGGSGSSYWQPAGGNDIINNNGGTVFLGGPTLPYEAIVAGTNNSNKTAWFQQGGSGDALYAEAFNGNRAILAQSGGTGIEARGGVYGVIGISEGPVGGFGVFGETLVPYGIGGAFRNELGGVGLEVIGKFDLLTPSSNGGFTPVQIAGVPGQSALTLSARFQSLFDNTYSLGISGFRWTTVYATNGTINTSDARQKQAIQPIGYGLQQVMAMKPVSFEWKSNPEQGRKLGFLAQDLQKIVPEVVADKEWVGDENGKQTVKPAEVLGVYYSDLIPVMAKAIQEQQAMIEALNIKNEMLQQKVDQYQTLEKELAALKTAVQALQNNADNK